MTMSTQTLDESARLLAAVHLIDQLQIMDVGPTVTAGTRVTRSLTPVGLPVAGLVQTITLENAVEGRVSQTFSVKVARATPLIPGQAVKVLFCRQEPDLAGAVFLIDTMSLNGLAMIRKGTASRARTVDEQGKGILA